MLTLTLCRRPGGINAIELRVPDIGLTPHQWAVAAFTATHAPRSSNYGDIPGAQEVAAALDPWPEPVTGLRAGDGVVVLGTVVKVETVEPRGDAWGMAAATFSPGVPVPVPVGPCLYVSVRTPPPDGIAYAEDSRDRLWTGRGYGEWRCLTDPAGRTAAGGWERIWVEHGPLTPLVPVTLLALPPDNR